MFAYRYTAVTELVDKIKYEIILVFVVNIFSRRPFIRRLPCCSLFNARKYCLSKDLCGIIRKYLYSFHFG